MPIISSIIDSRCELVAVLINMKRPQLSKKNFNLAISEYRLEDETVCMQIRDRNENEHFVNTIIKIQVEVN